MNQKLDTIIVGAGPAGFSAAIYTARAGLSTMVFGDETKSNLWRSHIIANYFAFPGNPTGPMLAQLGLTQALSFGTKHSKNEIVDLKYLGEDGFEVKDSEQNIYFSKTVILATGQSYVLSGIKGEVEFTGKGLSYCVTCDGFFYKEKPLFVIGSGDYAAQEALELTAYTSDITILSHGKMFTIGQKYLDALNEKKIKLLNTVKIASFTGSARLDTIHFQDGQQLPTEGVFMAIGIAGANAFAKKLGIETTGNYLKVNSDNMTNIPGLYAAGDCTGTPAQVAVSVGSGCNAALSVVKQCKGIKIYIQYN